ncbi:MAG: carboxypeptidase-like regulatory domain-containing protein [Tannerellaceae bacterium]|jgi:hypothetical protein|nr:carboxypeptidase-like regulatory domain-containing protein [Tannerellaceae bacterium]
MKLMKLLVTVFALHIINGFCVDICAQKLRAVVYDPVNRIPIGNATVFFEGSGLYTLTDGDGYFELMARDSVNVPLVISHVSYDKLLIQPPYILQDTIALEEKSIFMGEIVIEAGKYSGKQKMKAFKHHFLGDSRGGRSCVIENEDNIVLLYDSRENRLTATSSYPVIIRNSYLGYKIHLTLNRFEIRFNNSSLDPKAAIWVYYEGSSFFEDISSGNKTVKSRRDYIYKGSSPHFFKALSLNELKSSGYGILNGQASEILPVEAFTVTDSLDLKKIRVNNIAAGKDDRTYYGKEYSARIHVVHSYTKRSEVYFFNNEFPVDKYGNINRPGDILFTGFMGEQRIGDMLPIFYESAP